MNDQMVITWSIKANSGIQQVRWDEDIETKHQDRVSPWEIDPSTSLPPLNIQSSRRLKKLRTGLQADSPGHLITGMNPNADITK